MKLFRNFVAVCCCCTILVVGSSVAVYAQPIVSEDLSRYTVLTKSYETGEVTSEVVLPTNSLMAVDSEPRVTPGRMPSEEAYEIFGTQQNDWAEVASIQASDDRQPSNASRYPYCAIGRVEAWWDLNNGYWSVGSGPGCLEGPDVVYTCAHVIWDKELGWSQETWFYPGQTSDTSSGRPIQSEIINISIAQSYVDDGTDDWAIMQAEDDLGYLGWFGKGEATTALIGVEMTSSGYSGDKNGAQWRTVGDVERVAADYDSWIIHLSDVYVTPGHSGSPIYDDDYIVWGTFNFSGGWYDGGGRAIDSWLYDMLQGAYLEAVDRWDY